jgi:hypothetical protein
MTIKKTTTPSKPRLKRVYRCTLDLGHYITGSPARRYCFWHAVVKGQPERLLVVVQERRGKRDRTLYRAELDVNKTPGHTCGMDLDKFVLIFGGHHMFKAVEPELRRISRPMANLGTDHHYLHECTMEAGHGTETLQKWRDEVLYVLANKYQVRDHSGNIAMLRELYRACLTEETNNEELTTN